MLIIPGSKLKDTGVIKNTRKSEYSECGTPNPEYKILITIPHFSSQKY
jgi:hypothetical protein